MTVICNIYKSAEDLLPHFFQHYRHFGVKNFVFGVHDGAENPLFHELPKLFPAKASVELVESYRGDICGTKESDSLNTLRRASKTEWVIPADLDEFHVPCGYPTFDALIEACKEENALYVLSDLQDFISTDGTIPQKIDPHRPLYFQFPTRVNLTKDVLGACDRKVSLIHRAFSFTEGHHHIGYKTSVDFDVKRFSTMGVTRHYKWFGNLYEKELLKYTSYKEKGYAYNEENRKLLAYLESHSGKLL